MTFKEYFMLRESPDSARFLIPNPYAKKMTAEFDFLANNKFKIDTGLMTDKIMFFGSTKSYIHHSLLQMVAQDLAYDQELESGIKTFGTRDFEFIKICRALNSQYQSKPSDTTIFKRNTILVNYPQIVMYRSWDTGKSINFSFWNYASEITPNHKKLLANYIKSIGYSPEKSMFEVENEPITSEEFFGSDTTGSEKNTEYTPSDALHLMTPEKKKAALLAAGARPKVNTPIQDRRIRSGD